MYLLGKVDVSRRNLTMMNGIHHREYVIQSICVRRTVAYRVAFSRTGVEGDQAMNSSRSISSPYVQYTRIDPLLISISILSLSLSLSLLLVSSLRNQRNDYPRERKKDCSSYSKRYPVRILLIDIISSLHSRLCQQPTRRCIHRH